MRIKSTGLGMLGVVAAGMLVVAPPAHATVVATFAGGVLTVTADEDITLQCVTGTTKINGANSTPPAPCHLVTAIDVDHSLGGGATNLGLVTDDFFPALTGTTIEGSDQPEAITGSGFPDAAHGNEGDDEFLTIGAGLRRIGSDTFDGGPGDDLMAFEQTISTGHSQVISIGPSPGGTVLERLTEPELRLTGTSVERVGLQLSPDSDLVFVEPMVDTAVVLTGDPLLNELISIDDRGLGATEVDIGPIRRVTVPGRQPVDLDGGLSYGLFNGRIADYVDAVYQELLNRPAELEGLSYWADQIIAGAPRAAVASSIFLSAEYAGLLVDEIYADVLGRAPDAPGRAYWSLVLRDGAEPDELRGLLYGSAEYYADHGSSPQSYLEAVYADILGREIDDGGLAYWLDRLDQESRHAVALSILSFDEPRAVAIGGFYARFLGRAPGDSELPYWVGVWSVAGERVVVANIIGSDEYFARGARLTARLLVLAAAVLWGTTGTAQALGPDGASPVAVGAVRIAIGGAALCLLAWRRGTVHHLPAPRQSALAAAAIAAYQPCFFAGVDRTGVALGTVVAIGSGPVFAGLLAHVVWTRTAERGMLGERPGWRWLGATGLAVAGCGLLLGRGGSDVDAAGVVLALGAGLAYAVYVVATKRLLSGFEPAAVVTATFGLAAVILTPVALVAGIGPLVTPGGVLMALHLGLVATAAAYLLFARGLDQLGVASAATLSLAEPLTAGLLGVAVLDEHLTALAATGALLLLGGLVLAAAADDEPPLPD